MSKQDFDQIVILDDEEEPAIVAPSVTAKEDQTIFVFDDDQREVNHEPKNVLQVSADKDQLMSQIQYKKRISQLSDSIIMQNLTNFANLKKPEKNYFKEAKELRKSFEFQSRKSIRPIEQIVIEPKHEAIKVKFQDEASPRKKGILNLKESTQHYQYSMNDSVVEHKHKLPLPEIKQSRIGLSGVYSKKKNELKIEQDKNRNLLKVSNFREFLYSQLKPNYNIFIQIKKTDDGLINSTYKFYFQETKKFILSCEKQGFTKYVFSTSEIHISEEHISFLAKMDASFFGGEFLLYDSGEDCSRTKMMENYKKQMGFFTYAKEGDQPRKIEALITTCNNSSTDFTIVDKQTNLLQKKWEVENTKNISRLVSKSPNFDPSDHCFKLDFKGIAGIPSIKNFILQNEEYPDALIFGRKDKDEYIMRVRSPFSVVQAAAIAMSSIHYKFI